MEHSLDLILLSNSQCPTALNQSERQETYSETQAQHDSCKLIRHFSSKSTLSASWNENKQTTYIEPTIFFRDEKQLRYSYYNKLKQHKIGTEKKYNSIIFFDWDDTLCCSSYLIKSKIINCYQNNTGTPNDAASEKLSDTQIQKLAKLEFHILNILTIALNHGDTYIITNASENWVEYSAEKYFPSITNLFHRVKIISARSKFEAIYPNNAFQWKVEAFNEVAKTYNKHNITNIICLGDSIAEIEAAQNLSLYFPDSFIKTIKFREDPKPDHIIKQLNWVAKQFTMIHSRVKNLAIRVDKKKNKKEPSEYSNNNVITNNCDESESVASSLISVW